MSRTLLYDWHTAHGANMGEFSGYDMPLWYPAGAKKEHLAVIGSAGLFDTSHMGILEITGPHAFELLQFSLTKNIDTLAAGQCMYGIFLDENGFVIDDAIVYRLARTTFIVVVNAGMSPRIVEHLKQWGQGKSVEVDDLTHGYGKIDLQGPASPRILKGMFNQPDSIFNDLNYFTFKGNLDRKVSDIGSVTLKGGFPILLSRTGYTGELGFELILKREDLPKVWEHMLEAGKPYNLIPCGLAARDSLRAGAGLPLSHQDIGAWPFINNPWAFALPMAPAPSTGFSKSFIGDNALMSRPHSEYTHAFAGFDIRKVPAAEQTGVYDDQGKHIGTVLTCVTDVAIGRMDARIVSRASPNLSEDFCPKGLCCGFIKVNRKLPIGQIVELKDNRRSIKVEVVTDIRPARTARGKLTDFI